MAIEYARPVALSLGSNFNRYRNLSGGLDALSEEFGELLCSPVYESEAVGFAGNHFLNLVVLIRTDRALSEISPILKQIEDEHGRIRQGPRYSPRTLDIDVITYDDLAGVHDGIKLPREETARNAFILRPMADLLPSVCMPGTDRTYAELWAAYPKHKQKLWRVPFHWHDYTL